MFSLRSVRTLGKRVEQGEGREISLEERSPSLLEMCVSHCTQMIVASFNGGWG